MFSELFPVRPEVLADTQYCYADGRMGDVYICSGTARAARVAVGCCLEVGGPGRPRDGWAEQGAVGSVLT